MLRTHRTKILALLLLAVGLAAGALAWRANTGTTTGTTGGGDVFTQANNAAECTDQASAFADYPLVWAGDSVLSYPLTYCAHMMTKTRRDEEGHVSHPGGDAWVFGYGDCTPSKGHDSCAPPITLRVDPCALLVDGGIIPRGSRPVRSIVVRGAQADIYQDGVLVFEQSPQVITIYAPPQDYQGQGVDVYAAERAANAVTIAEALIPANALADGLSKGEPLTAAFLKDSDTFCASSSGASNTPISERTKASAASAPVALSDSVISANKTACAQLPTTIAHQSTAVADDILAVETVVIRSTPVVNGDDPVVQTATADRIANGIAGGLTQVARGATVVANINATAFAAC